MYIDLKNLGKLDPQKRAQFEKLLEAYPEMASKMDTSRELNTPVANEMKKKKETVQHSVPTAEDEGFVNYDELKPEPDTAPRKAPTIEMEVNPSENWNKSFEKETVNKALEEEEEKTPEKKEAAPKKEPRFSTNGKEHPVLAKLKATLGMGINNPSIDVSIGGTTYSLHRVMRDEIVKATTYAALKSVTETDLKANIENAVVAFSIERIDGVPIEDVFEVPREEFSVMSNRKLPLSTLQRREKASELLFTFLKGAPNELVELLVVYYDQNFANLDLVEKDKTFAYCPSDHCQHKKVKAITEVTFCPFHGKELINEEDLPNPF